jgi:hypothetical protein
MVGGLHLDFLYCDLGTVAGAIKECRRGKPKSVYQLGHPLGFHNQIYAGEVACCQPLFDPHGAVEELKNLVRNYPAALRRATMCGLFRSAGLRAGSFQCPHMTQVRQRHLSYWRAADARHLA